MQQNSVRERRIQRASHILIISGSNHTKIVVYTGFRGWGGSRQAWGGTFLHWRNQKFRIFSNSQIFKKMLKNQ